jgi:transcription initiation factor TFIIIB Brf1 subunit/transcription initiation factor TFIIB
MSEYSDVKRKDINRFLRWLNTKKNIAITQGGKHNYLVKYAFANRPFPIPIHDVVNKHIIKDLMKHLVEDWKVCTKEEFDEGIK